MRDKGGEEPFRLFGARPGLIDSGQNSSGIPEVQGPSASWIQCLMVMVMVMYGHVGSCMVMYGPVWSSMNMYGHIWSGIVM